MQDFRFHGYAKDREDSDRGRHSREMSRSARAGDDYFQAAVFGAFGVFEQQVRRAMGRHDFAFVRHAEFCQQLRGMLERLPVGGAPHDDANLWTCLGQRRNSVKAVSRPNATAFFILIFALSPACVRAIVKLFRVSGFIHGHVDDEPDCY